MTWRERAACRGMDVRIFYPDEGQQGLEAKRICARCPVRQACLDHAIAEREEHGIWGGIAIKSRQRQRWRVNSAARERNVRRSLVERARLISADATAHNVDPVQAVMTRLMVDERDARALLGVQVLAG